MGSRSHATARRGMVLAAILTACATHAAEMPRPEPEPPAPPAFDDWALVCAGTCDIRTRIVGRDGSDVLTLVARAGDGGAFGVETPLPLFLPDPVRLTLGPAEPRAIPWRTCGVGRLRGARAAGAGSSGGSAARAFGKRRTDPRDRRARPVRRLASGFHRRLAGPQRRPLIRRP